MSYEISRFRIKYLKCLEYKVSGKWISGPSPFKSLLIDSNAMMRSVFTPQVRTIIASKQFNKTVKTVLVRRKWVVIGYWDYHVKWQDIGSKFVRQHCNQMHEL